MSIVAQVSNNRHTGKHSFEQANLAWKKTIQIMAPIGVGIINCCYKAS